MTLLELALVFGLLPSGVQPAGAIGGPWVNDSIAGIARGAGLPEQNANAQPPEAPDDRAGGWRFRWMPTPSLRFGNVVRLNLRARLRLDAAASPVPDPERTGAFDVGQRRIGVDGRLFDAVEFEVEREFGSDDSWRDVYVDYTQFDAVRVQAGQFKLPFSLDENTGQPNLDFTHRSRAATHLAPGRDRGIMLHGRPFTRLVRYEVGVFAHDGDNARTNNPERVYGETTVAARMTVRPFAGRKSHLADLRGGMAVTTSRLPEGFPAIRGETALDARFFRGDVWVYGRRQRTGFEFRWRPGPFSLQAEYMRTADERRGESVENTDLPPLVGAGWYVSGTWLLTGERKAGLDDPKRPLLPGPGIGAVEVAARVEALTFRSGDGSEPPSRSPRAEVITGNTLHGITMGVNWYLNRWMKIQGNLIRERIEDPAQGPIAPPVFWSKVLFFRFTL